MLNLICNDCVGARVYENLNLEFANPFMWNQIMPDNFLKLIKDIDTIDFNNVSSKIECGIAFIVINNDIEIPYVHYKYDITKTSPQKQDIDILYNEIDKYALDKFNKRTERLYKNKKYVFILHANNHWTKNDVIRYINIETPYKKVLVYDDEEVNKIAKAKGILVIKPMRGEVYQVGRQLAKDNSFLSFIEHNNKQHSQQVVLPIKNIEKKINRKRIYSPIY